MSAMRCSRCGSGNRDGRRFCGHCGASLMAGCPSCGFENEPGAKFCGGCGTALNVAAPAMFEPQGPMRHSPLLTDAERRQLTVMFCDLVDSTALSKKLDPEETRDIIHAFQESCAPAIARFDGFVAKYMGDGILVYFGYPQAHEDEAERAVRSGLAVMDAMRNLNADMGRRKGIDLAVRIGIATGVVVVGDLIGEGVSEERTVVGATPNLAARLQSLADRNAMIISDETHQLLGRQFECEDLGDTEIKGFSEPIRAWRVIGPSQIQSRFEAKIGSRATPLVGRRHEMACLLDRWRDAKEGEGQVVLISGEPGIGKSRLTLAIQNQIADTPHTTLRYQCSPYHQNSALHPVVEQISRAGGFEHTDTDEQRLDKLEELLMSDASGGADRMVLLAEMLSIATENRYPPLELSAARKKEETLASLVEEMRHRAARQPLLVVFEDVHWIDPTSLELLDLIVEQAQAHPFLVVITFRPEFDAKWIGQAQVTLLALNRMTRRQCAAMVERITGGKTLPEEVLAQIVTRTDGVPLFVEELTKTVLQSHLLTEKSAGYALNGPLPPLAIPATLQDSLMARLDQSAPVRELAQWGATIGREFSHRLLARIWPPENGDLDKAFDQLLGSELIFRRGTGPDATYVFKHALIRDTAYESLLHSKRRSLHARIAEVLEIRFPQTAETEPELLAHHLSEAGLNEQATEYWRRAARHAADRSANIEAIGHFLKAIVSVGMLSDTRERAQQEVEIKIALAMVLRVVDRYDTALTRLAEAERTARACSLIRELAQIHYCRGNVYFALANVEGCLQEHEQARTFAREAQSPCDEARAVGGLGDAHYLRGDMRAACEHFRQCVELSRRHGFPDIEVTNLHMVGWSRVYFNEQSEAVEDGLATVEAAIRVHHLRAEMLGHGLVGSVSMDLAKWKLVDDHLAEAVKLAQRLGTRTFEGSALSYQARALHLQRRREALPMAERALAVSRRSEMTFHGPYVLGVMALTTDKASVRHEAFEEAETILRKGCVSHNYFWFYRDAMDASLEAGEWADAERFAQALEDYTAAAPLPWSSFYIARGRTLAAAGRGVRSEFLREEIDRLRHEAERAGLMSALPALEKALGT